MKVLIVYRDSLNDNLFVQVLRDNLIKGGCDVCCSVKKFWQYDNSFDIVHIQWPEELYEWNDIPDNFLTKLQNQINAIKSSGAKIVYTRHNIVPHYADKKVIEIYKLVEKSADTIVHMGNFSMEEIKSNTEICPDVKNVLIPHHIYENTYDENITCQSAREKLGIPQNKFVIAAFGKFRNKEEVKMVLKSFFAFKQKNKYLLAPRILVFSRNTFAKKIFYWMVKTLLSMFHVYSGAYDELISNEDLPYFVQASDVIFVQRKSILNSGNVPLGFLFKKVVIGPNIANVGELLSQTGNPTFNPDNINSITGAMHQAYLLKQQDKGMSNYQWAKENMGVEKVAGLYIKAYKDLINNK